MKTLIIFAALITMSLAASAQPPQIGTGVSHELAKWRSARYSDVRYKLNLTLEKMSPVLKGTMEIRVKVKGSPPYEGGVDAALGGRGGSPLVLDWRKIRGHEDKSTISNVSINGKPAVRSAEENHPVAEAATPLLRKEGSSLEYSEQDEHLIFRDGAVVGENVIRLDFTSPILPSGSAITRYVDKEDGSEYIYSLFVPSDASTAFPVFDQPDLKARFKLSVTAPADWTIVANSIGRFQAWTSDNLLDGKYVGTGRYNVGFFDETKPISTYVFAFAAGPWESVSMPGPADKSVPPAVAGGLTRSSPNAVTSTVPSFTPTSTTGNVQPPATAGGTDMRAGPETFIYVRKSQAAKFKPHAAEVFRLNREAVKYFEQYFDYRFPFPKYDLVLIPEFPFGGMEHAGATFLSEASIIFPQEPTKNDHISRATLIFHEAAHQWFGDTVTMRWFDDLWLKEGFATFTAYKALEKIMPEMNAWKVFYERIKQGAYQTDSTRGTTAIYQPIANLSAAKSAYGNIVYNKAPAFLRQAEFYLGEDKFQTAVRAFLKKHEFGNAGWEDLVKEFEAGSETNLSEWADFWVKRPGLTKIRITQIDPKTPPRQIPGFITLSPDWISDFQADGFPQGAKMPLMKGMKYARGAYRQEILQMGWSFPENRSLPKGFKISEYEYYFIFPNYGDYGYGIFLLDEKSRDYVLKNIQNEKDPFLRTMMWGALWDSVREGELDPRVFVELVVQNLAKARTTVRAISSTDAPELDESTVQLLLSRVSVAMSYYIPAPDIALTNVRASAPEDALRSRVEEMLIERMQNAPGLGQRITYYRAFLNVATSEKAREVLKGLLATGGNLSGSEGVPNVEPRSTQKNTLPTGRVSASIPLKTKDRFDIVTRLLILNDPDAPKLLAELEKAETSDEAKRYAYAAKAGIATAENKAKYWKEFTENKDISESWIEAAFGPWNSIRHSDLTLPYLQKALQELPNHRRNRKIFFVNGWLGAFIGGQRSPEALAIVNKFLADNPGLDNDLRLKILENVDLIERAVNIRRKFPQV